MPHSDVVALEWVHHTDPRMSHVTDLRHTVLMAPFGVKRDENWGDDEDWGDDENTDDEE